MPHFESASRGAWEEASALAGVTMIDPREDPLSVIAAIGKCRVLMSEALRGIIVADNELDLESRLKQIKLDLIDAHEAHRIGLVNEVVPATELIPRCAAILKQMNGNAELAIRDSINAVNEGVDTDLTSGLKLEAKYFVLAAGTEDKKEGTSAFVQKRAPQFQGTRLC